MADNVKPTYAKSDVKSGLVNEKYAETVLGGTPEKKSVDAIEKENEVKHVKGTAKA